MKILKDWLGISPLETRMLGADSAINQAFLHIEELRGHLEKLSEIVLKHEARTWIQTEISVVKPKKKAKKDGK